MEKALIIEDDKDIADLIAIHLADLEFDADIAYDGKEGGTPSCHGFVERF